MCLIGSDSSYKCEPGITEETTQLVKTVGIGSDSSYKCEPGIINSSDEKTQLAARLKFTLVGRFSHGFLNLNFLRLKIVKLGLKGNVIVGMLNFKHVLIYLTNEEDFSRLWLRGEWTFDSFYMRVFKWTPIFDPQIESSIAPVWIRLPELPVHLFEKKTLFTLVAKIGKSFRMDEPTADLARPDLARLCTEVDLMAPKVQAVYLQIEGKTYGQQVLYENCPPYCSSCNHLGHDISIYIAKHNSENHSEMEPRPPGNALGHNEDIRDLRKIINNRRKCKNVAIDNVLASIFLENNADNSETIDLPLNANVHANVIDSNANVDFSPISHVPEPKQIVTPDTPAQVT
ncbi:UNVERIFIED_CONTAM: hypothetical protein Slati_4432000 [Sesamum latifolium]|uniref:DUF4283 domain-containing protein n=1 Tax=Sesamum latifolium TaxID=2727402 RepID=A0AAW2SQD7_9LAMI